MDYKNSFTQGEIDELLEWFKAHEDQLPESMQVAPGFFISELKKTVHYYYDLVQTHWQNPIYSGQVYHLFKIRDILMAEKETATEE